NPFGGAIALGHPFGMTGARIMTTLLNGLEAREGTYGIESMGVAGGMGMAMRGEALVRGPPASPGPEGAPGGGGGVEVGVRVGVPAACGVSPWLYTCVVGGLPRCSVVTDFPAAFHGCAGSS